MRTEVKRQLFHAILLLSVAIGSIWETQATFLIGAFILLIFFIWVSRTDNKFTRWALSHFGRPHASFPAKGAVTAAIGLIATGLFFPAHVFPAVLVLALADSLATIVGTMKGSHRIGKFKKTWEGTLTVFIVTAVILHFFSPLWWLIALIVTAVEFVDVQSQFIIDDNILMPVITALLLSIF